jgi:hypothetical protein
MGARHLNLATLLTALTPAAAAGIAILCGLLGVFAAQLAAREWRAAEDAGPRADDSDLVRVHGRASGAFARAKAEGYQFSSTILLLVSGAIASYAIVPGLPTESIGGIALAGGIYFIADAFLSARAELKSIADDELFNAFKVRSPGLEPDSVWVAFALERPAVARRLKHRKVEAAD